MTRAGAKRAGHSAPAPSDDDLGTGMEEAWMPPLQSPAGCHDLSAEAFSFSAHHASVGRTALVLLTMLEKPGRDGVPQDCALAGRACAQGSCASEARSVMPQIDNFRAAGLFAQHRGGVVLVFDTFDKASLSRAWENEGEVIQAKLGARVQATKAALRARSGSWVEVDVVLPGSCLGLWLRRQAFGAAALGQPLFKNILGYIWGMWRAAQVAEFALHVDDDVRLAPAAYVPPPHLSPRCSSAWNTSAKGAWLVAPLAWLHAALRARPSLLALGFEKARLREAFRCEVTDVGGCRCGLPKIPSGELETSGPLLLSRSPRARRLCPRGSAAICAQELTRLDGSHCAYGREGYTPHGRLFSMRAFLARSAALVAAWPLEPLPGFMNRHNHTVLARWSWQPRLEMNRVLAASHPELVYEAAAMARGLQVLYVDPWTAGLQRVDLIP